MFSFTKEQIVVDISGIKIGGQPGEYPTTLFGGFFFKGEPDFIQAKKHLDTMYACSQKTGNPAIADFFVREEEYIEDIIKFILENVPKNNPFSIDIIDPDLKIKTLKVLSENNLLKRTIYNSIHVGTTGEEREVLKRNTPNAAILVAFNPKDKSPDGKIEVLENGANLLDIGLLGLVKDLGIKKILVDTAAMAPGDNSGASIAAIPVIKEEYGFPTGCAIHNVVEKSKWLEELGFLRRPVDAASNINIPLFGGDFAIYGPAERSKLVFPVVAWQDILVAEYAENYFGISPVPSHPRRTLLK